jgi:hypothetical protein
MASGLKASSDGKALFLFDRLGGIHALGESEVSLSDRNAPYFKKPGMAVDIEWAPGEQGFVFLDAFEESIRSGASVPCPNGVRCLISTGPAWRSRSNAGGERLLDEPQRAALPAAWNSGNGGAIAGRKSRRYRIVLHNVIIW